MFSVLNLVSLVWGIFSGGTSQDNPIFVPVGSSDNPLYGNNTP